MPVGELRWKAAPGGRGRLHQHGARPSGRWRPPSARTGWRTGRFDRRSSSSPTAGRPTSGTSSPTGSDALTSFPAGRASLRLAIAIGHDAKSEFLDQFIGDPTRAGDRRRQHRGDRRAAGRGLDRGLPALRGRGRPGGAGQPAARVRLRRAEGLRRPRPSSDAMGDPARRALRDGRHSRWAVLVASTRGAAHERLRDGPTRTPRPGGSSTAGRVVVARRRRPRALPPLPGRARRPAGGRTGLPAAPSALGRRLGAAGSTAERRAVRDATRWCRRSSTAWRRAVAADHDELAVHARRGSASGRCRRRRRSSPTAPRCSSRCSSERWVLVAQIGDGDVVALRADGRGRDRRSRRTRRSTGTTRPACASPRAVGSFRIAVIDRAARPVLAVLLATDGFGNAQASDPWPPAVGADLAVDARRARHAPGWRDQLPTWTERCASTEGSGDDTTVVLVVRRPMNRLPAVGDTLAMSRARLHPHGRAPAAGGRPGGGARGLRRRRRLRPEVAAPLGPRPPRCGPRSPRWSSARARTRPSSGPSTSCMSDEARGVRLRHAAPRAAFRLLRAHARRTSRRSAAS